MEILDDWKFSKSHEATVENASKILELRKKFDEKSKIVKHGKYALIAVIVFQVIATIYEGITTQGDLLVLGINLGLLFIYVGLLFYSEKNPKNALLFVAILYSVLILLLAILQPLSIFKGILLKGLILYYVIRGAIHAKEFSQSANDLSDYGVSVNTKHLGF